MNDLLSSILSAPLDFVLKFQQIEKNRLEKKEKKKAKLIVNVENRRLKGCDKILIIENIGESDACNIELTIQDKEEMIIFTLNSKKKFSTDLINSKSKSFFDILIPIGSDRSFNLLLKWSDKYKNDNSELRSVSYTW